MKVNPLADIETVEDIPQINSAEELNEKIENAKQLHRDGDGWYDACLRVGENDAQKYVLTQLMLREVRGDRDNNN